MHRLKNWKSFFFFLFFWPMPLHQVGSLICKVMVWPCKDAERHGLVCFSRYMTFACSRESLGGGGWWWGVLDVPLTGPLASSGCRHGKMTLLMNEPLLTGGKWGHTIWDWAQQSSAKALFIFNPFLHYFSHSYTASNPFLSPLKYMNKSSKYFIKIRTD